VCEHNEQGKTCSSRFCIRDSQSTAEKVFCHFSRSSLVSSRKEKYICLDISASARETLLQGASSGTGFQPLGSLLCLCPLLAASAEATDQRLTSSTKSWSLSKRENNNKENGSSFGYSSYCFAKVRN
jgi:hypothetical protein